MTSRNFTYWLQGFFELTDSDKLTEEQVRMIKEHLSLVFTKVTGQSGISSEELLLERDSPSGSTCGTSATERKPMSCGTSGTSKKQLEEEEQVRKTGSHTGHSSVHSDPRDYVYSG